MNRTPRLSIAIPLYNEESNLPELYRRVTAVIDEIPGGPHEIVFVNDGSTDQTWPLLMGIAAADPRIKAVTLSRNFGHQAALTAGLDHATGDVIVCMDGDLQDTPETIPRLLAEYQNGYDVVYAIRHSRKEGWFLRLCYSAAYYIIDKMSALRLPRGAGDFALMSRRVVDQIRQTDERNRYLRGLRTWVGFRQIGVPVERAARFTGQPKYTFRRLCQLAFDGIFSFSIVPIRAVTVLGFTAIVVSILYACREVFIRLVYSSPAGFTSTIVAMVFLAGVQLFFMGIIGEYIARIYEEVKRRPHYIVDQLVQSSEAMGEGRTPAGSASGDANHSDKSMGSLK